jgi:SAM-dependent methyltransferase
MRDAGRRRHPDAAIQWAADALPELAQVLRLGLSFDFILLNAVWMHVAPADRARAFRKLVTLLKPGGRMAITLRHGPHDPARGDHPVSQAEIETLARDHGAFLERSVATPDHLGRAGISWTGLILRLPDDGSGALPLLRHVILNDDKSSTYKPALLRVLCRIAAGAGGLARACDDDRVALPLGLVALYWLRLFKPLLAADMPQSPINRGYDGLGFVSPGFQVLEAISQHDLRVGMRLGPGISEALHEALWAVCGTILKMPVRYMTYPGGGPILNGRRQARPGRPGATVLDPAYLASFGELFVPAHIWRALQRFQVWIEPALVAEWSRLMAFYAERQGRKLAPDAIGLASAWSEPGRDVAVARQQALLLLQGGGLHCVWSGRALSADRLDIDHCFPWSAWPCDDLWNLLPSDPRINRREKRDRLPGDGRLRAAQERIQEWWSRAYVAGSNGPMRERFRQEAMASLPAFGASAQASAGGLDDVFDGVMVQQLRLRHDQQVPVWA